MSQGAVPSRFRLSLPLTPSSTGQRSSTTSPSLYAANRLSPELTSLTTTTEEPNDGVENEEDRGFDDFEEKAFFVLDKTTRPRNWCITAVMWPYPCRFLSQFILFLPCDAMRCTVFVIVILSVCLSVCLYVTLVDCVHMVRPTIMISSPYGSPIILVSGDITLMPKFEGGHPERGR